MGIDRHELEHRNWRSSKAPKPSSAKEIANEIAEQLDTSIVPSDNLAGDGNARSPKSRVKREKTDQLR